MEIGGSRPPQPRSNGCDLLLLLLKTYRFDLDLRVTTSPSFLIGRWWATPVLLLALARAYAMVVEEAVICLVQRLFACRHLMRVSAFRPKVAVQACSCHLHVLSKPWTEPWAKLTMSLTLAHDPFPSGYNTSPLFSLASFPPFTNCSRFCGAQTTPTSLAAIVALGAPRWLSAPVAFPLRLFASI